MRVGLYARVSTEAQEARGTIGSQLEALRARVRAAGDELMAEFVDDGYSGARLDRPGLDTLRDAAEAGRIEAVWCLSPGRLARSFAYQMLILDELSRLGVAVYFTDSPPIDSDPQARLLVQVQGVIAEYERAKFAERERRGKLYRARAGEVLSRKVPYGYRRVPRGPAGPAHLIVHEAEAAALGRHRQRRRPPEEWVAIPIPAIVDEETFEAAARAARDNTAFSPRRTEPGTFLLRRLARCGRCGVKLARHRAHREYGLARYYLCPHHDPVRAGGQDRRCTERRIRADELDTFVFDQVQALLARPGLLAGGEAAVAAQAPVPDDELLSTQLTRLDRRAQAAQAERRRLADLYQAGVIEAAEMARRAAELQSRRQHLDDQRQALITRRAELTAHNRLGQRIEAFAARALAGLDRLDFNGRQQLLRLVLEDVRVQGWQVELRLRIPLDQTPPDDTVIPALPRRTGTRDRSPRGPGQAKEGVSSNDGLRSIGQRLPDLPDVHHHPAVPAAAPPAAPSGHPDHLRRRSPRPAAAGRDEPASARQPRPDHRRARNPGGHQGNGGRGCAPTTPRT
jgi:DNA invertase Pin-like site-specific DNA recombinase